MVASGNSEHIQQSEYIEFRLYLERIETSEYTEYNEHIIMEAIFLHTGV